MALQKSNVGTTLIRRVRIGQAFLSIAVLVGASLGSSVNPFVQWWFWVAATTSFTISVVEPYFTAVTGALMYSVGAIGAGITAKRDDVELLWMVYFTIAGLVFMSALFSMVVVSDRPKEVFRWISTRFGRPLWLGLFAIAIETLRQAVAVSLGTASYIALGTMLALLLAVPDWYRLLVTARPTLGGLATIETAVEPNLVLLTTSQRFDPGSSVYVEGTGGSAGVVIGNLAHKGGNRIQVALEHPWYEVAQSSGQQCVVIASDSGSSRPVAFVAEGSTDRTLSLRPFGSLTRGDTVYWEQEGDGRKYLYQILGRQLVREMWDSSTVVSEHASAVMLGAVDSGGIVYGSALPAPYVPVFTADSLTGDLPAGYGRIGCVAGTKLPFGISVDRLKGHHLAILGMSGMGKSTIARRIIEMLSSGSVVIALDGTGESRSRFGLPTWNDAIGLSTLGAWVYEPAGVQAEKASTFIDRVMGEAAREYASGTPLNRTLLLEEAHSYLPEWNFTAARNESDFVAKSCRCILQARKFGISFVLVSQRTAVISKSALSQCESYIVLRTLDETSLQYIEGVLGRELRDTVSGLARYWTVPGFMDTGLGGEFVNASIA